jgi:hypothetical protein
MPAELLNLQEQLANLQVVYEAALRSDITTHDDLVKLRQQILDIQSKIIQRKKLLSENQ